MTFTKTFAFTLILVFSFCTTLWAQADPKPRRQFVHPGVSHSAASIELVKEKLAAGEEPWTGAWKRLSRTEYASLDWKPAPFAVVERGPYNDPDIGSTEFSADAKAAYYHTLCWAISGKEAHAKKAAEILNAWSETHQEVKNHDAALLIGMSGYHFCVGAELLKHTWDKWPAKEQEQFETMLREKWYPVIKDFYATANGNWDASMMQCMIAMAVIMEDEEMFDKVTDYYREGYGNGAIGNYFKPSGQCQETGRDQAHTQMGLEFLANTAETAWIQGVDLYGELDNRLLKGFEYTAKYNLGNDDVPYEPYESVEGRYHYKKISRSARGRLRPMYERVHNHYFNRIGIEAPFTIEAALKLRASDSERSRNDSERSRNDSERSRNDSERSRKESETNRDDSERSRVGSERERRGRGGRKRRRRRSSSALDTLMYAGVPSDKTTTDKAPSKSEPTVGNRK